MSRLHPRSRLHPSEMAIQKYHEKWQDCKDVPFVPIDDADDHPKANVLKLLRGETISTFSRDDDCCTPDGDTHGWVVGLCEVLRVMKLSLKDIYLIHIPVEMAFRLEMTMEDALQENYERAQVDRELISWEVKWAECVIAPLASMVEIKDLEKQDISKVMIRLQCNDMKHKVQVKTSKLVSEICEEEVEEVANDQKHFLRAADLDWMIPQSGQNVEPIVQYIGTIRSYITLCTFCK